MLIKAASSSLRELQQKGVELSDVGDNCPAIDILVGQTTTVAY